MAFNFSPIFRFKVQGKSMEPAFNHGSRVFVSRLAYVLVDPEIDEVVVLRHPKEEMLIIKRIKDISHEGHYFVLGDNFDHSTDSRHFGRITKEHIVGKVIEL